MNQLFHRVPLEANRAPLLFPPGADPGQGLQAGLAPSLTYEPYYGLKEKAFSLSADPRFLYRSPAHAPAFDELLMGIKRREGLIVLTGEVGTGKTTLIQSVLEHLDRRTFTAFVPDPFVTREDLLKMLLVDFGVVSVADLKQGSLASATRPDLSYSLYEFLDSLVPLQAFAVLIIDEAQNLPLPLLEEIRILSDLEQREKLLQVVLVGQPELRSHLKLPELRQVNQRVSVRCELRPLGLDHVGEYVRHRLSVASGGESRIEFTAAAIAAVHSASGGFPRVINLICDRALQRGQAARAARIDSVLIDEAVEVLGLEPTGSHSPAIADAATRAERGESAAPAPSRVVQPSAVSVKNEETVAPYQFLAEFASEGDTRNGLRSGVRLWRLVASLLLAALAAAGGAAVVYTYVTNATSGASTATLPARPAWTTALKAPAPPPALPDVARSPSAPPAVPASGNARPSSTPDSPGRFSIQVAAFGSRARADRLVSELRAGGLRARIIQVDNGSTSPLLLIRVDGYDTVDAASRDLARIHEIPGYGDARLLAN